MNAFLIHCITVICFVSPTPLSFRAPNLSHKEEKVYLSMERSDKIPLSSKSGPLADPDVAKHGIGILRARKVRRAGCERSELAAGEGVV